MGKIAKIIRSKRSLIQGLGFIGCLFISSSGLAYTANKVWMEFQAHGIYRVYVNYTVPALKEFREVYVDFTSKKEAESYYFDLLRGADFYLPDPKRRRFTSQPMEPQGW